MYNGQIIKALLKQQGKKKKDLLEALGVNYGGSIRPFVEGNPTVGKLEAIADFFGVSMDTFFIRDKKPSISVVGNSNNVACVTIKGLEERLISRFSSGLSVRRWPNRWRLLPPE